MPTTRSEVIMHKELLFGLLFSITGSPCSAMIATKKNVIPGDPNVGTMGQKELREEFLSTHPNITLPEGITWDDVKIVKEAKKTLGQVFYLYRLFYLKKENFDNLFK
jgi:hypothetical protein